MTTPINSEIEQMSDGDRPKKGYVKSGPRNAGKEKKKKDEAVAKLKELYANAEEYDVLHIPVDAITPYENNPRLNAPAVPYLIEAIKEYGFRSPIVVDENFVVLSGHTRLMAVKELGWDTIPTLVARGLTEEQKTAYRIADNQVGAVAGWDFDALELEFMKITTINMERFACNFSFAPCDPVPDDDDGYSDDDPSDSGSVLPSTDVDITEDPVPEIQEECDIEPGDVLFLGDALVIHCREYSDEVVGHGPLAFLCPPYDDPKRMADMAETAVESVDFVIGYSDTFKADKSRYTAFLSGTVGHLKDIFYWSSDNPPLARQGCVSTALSPLPVFSKDTAPNFGRELGGFTGEIKGEHADTLPMYVYAQLVQLFTSEGDTVLSLYSDNGDVMSVCRQLGRKCVIYEPDPRKCDVIKRRWEMMEGKHEEPLDDNCEDSTL